MVVYKRLRVQLLTAAFTYLFSATSVQLSHDDSGVFLLRAQKWLKFNLTTCYDVSEYFSYLTSYLYYFHIDYFYKKSYMYTNQFVVACSKDVLTLLTLQWMINRSTSVIHVQSVNRNSEKCPGQTAPIKTLSLPLVSFAPEHKSARVM